MDSNLVSVASLLFGLLIGGGVAYYVASRPILELRNKLNERELEFKTAIAELGEAKIELSAAKERAARADGLAGELDQARQENATFKAERAGFAEQKKLLEESRDKLLKEFENTGAQVLGKAQEAFLRRADERFKQSEEAGEQKIKALLNPVGERLEKYEKQVETLENQRINAFGELKGLLERMNEGQKEVQREAQRLGSSLRNAPKARGSWGENQLKNVLEQCGLGHHTDFLTEHSVEGSEGRLRPDAIVRVPGNKLLIIDSKVSLNDYQDAFDADDEDQRDRFLDKHVASMRSHVTALGSKSYQSQFDEAPDYVIMFVPGEHFVSAAIEHDLKKRKEKLGEDALLNADDLWNFAFKNRVILATPTNLVAIARTVAQVWRQDKIAKEAIEIGKAGTELYDRLATAAQHLKRVGGGLDSAVKNYNKFVGSFERNVLSSGKRLADKGIEIGKREIDEVPLVESSPNYNAADADEVDALEDGREAAE